MSILLGVIKWFLIALLALLVLVILILTVKIGFYAELLYTKKDGFKFNGKLTYGLFVKSIGEKDKKKDDKKAKKEQKKEDNKEDNKKEKKSIGETVDLIKASANLAVQLKWLPRKVLEFKKECVWCKVALSDPMKNGTTYGIISGALISAVTTIACCFKTDEYKVRVTPDFVANDGISIKNITWVRLRPIFLIICLVWAYIRNKDLREAVQELLHCIKKDKEKERSREKA